MKLFTILATLSVVLKADAARICGTTASTTYKWNVNDARYDGADRSKGDGLATVAISVSPGSSGTLFECVSQWSESWAGRYEGGSRLIWSDCIWAGNARTQDTAVSFALDWAKRAMYFSHTFNCSDASRSDALAIGTVNLGVQCGKDANATETCSLKSATALSTKIEPPRLKDDATCADISARYQSWQVEKWLRRYNVTTAGALSDARMEQAADTGPSFMLKNMATNSVFSCATSSMTNATFSGVCTLTGGGQSATTANFTFDLTTSMLTLTERWSCDGSLSMDSVGIGYVQADCSRQGNTYTCISKPLWIGTDAFP